MRIPTAAPWFALALIASTPAIPYFTNVRDVTAVANRQNYIVVDEEIWQHARPDLADIRLYKGEQQVPYVLRERRTSPPAWSG